MVLLFLLLMNTNLLKVIEKDLKCKLCFPDKLKEYYFPANYEADCMLFG